MGAAIWSADPATFTDIPVGTFARFFDNHGLLRLADRPRWRTVAGGTARYVEAIVARCAGRPCDDGSRRSCGAGRRGRRAPDHGGARRSSTTSSWPPTATRP